MKEDAASMPNDEQSIMFNSGMSVEIYEYLYRTLRCANFDALRIEAGLRIKHD